MARALGSILKHLWLARRMAKASGVDLSAAYDAGDLSQKQWADMVRTCRSCQWEGGCQRHLAKLQNPGEVPEQCLNKSRFDALKA